jgi:hypothetical protein
MATSRRAAAREELQAACAAHDANRIEAALAGMTRAGHSKSDTSQLLRAAVAQAKAARGDGPDRSAALIELMAAYAADDAVRIHTAIAGLSPAGLSEQEIDQAIAAAGRWPATRSSCRPSPPPPRPPGCACTQNSTPAPATQASRSATGRWTPYR